jgi:hypothetical protein
MGRYGSVLEAVGDARACCRPLRTAAVGVVAPADYGSGQRPPSGAGRACGPGWLRALRRPRAAGRPRRSEVAEAARFAAVGYAAVMFDAVGGEAAATDAVARWSGQALDPSIAAVFLDAPGELLRMSDPDDVWAAVVDAEPTPRRTFRDDVSRSMRRLPPSAMRPTSRRRGFTATRAASRRLLGPPRRRPPRPMRRSSIAPGSCTISAALRFRRASGSATDRCDCRSGSRSACTRTTRAGSSRARRCSPRSQRSRAVTTSA